jgi:hypothetical protein
MPSEVLRRVVVRRCAAGWVAEDADGSIIAEGVNKPAVVKHTAAALRESAEPTTLRIENVHRTLDEMRTYPEGRKGSSPPPLTSRRANARPSTTTENGCRGPAASR